MKKILFLSGILFLSLYSAYAQYAPQAGITGSTAINAADARFVGWATACQLQRGLMDIAQPSYGYTTTGDNTSALGKPDAYVVSLGDSGVAVLTFTSALYNGPGPDFAVFENGFIDPANGEVAFLELAFVEVSSDGTNFFRFPANSQTQTTTQIKGSGDYMNARLINNLAGKYASKYGTPFDLDELKETPGLDVDHITHVRIVDVIGSLGAHATHDSSVRIINDPYPTAYPTGGFDLDAVGAIYQLGTDVQSISNTTVLNAYPNPTTGTINITLTTQQQNSTAILTDATGKILLQQTITQNNTELNIVNYQSGIYYLILRDTNGGRWAQTITKL